MSNSELEFVQLLTSNQARLFAYILSLVGDPHRARDVQQETNEVLWRKSGEFARGTNFPAWMLRTAYYQVLAHRQRLGRERLVFDDELAAGLAEAAAERNEAFEERQALLHECLEKLPDRQRELVRARYQEGYELPDLATRTQRSKEAVKQALFRARANLVDCVKSRMQEEMA